MAVTQQPQGQPTVVWVLLSAVCLLLGLVVGHFFAGIGGAPVAAPAAAAQPVAEATPGQPIVDERQVQTYRDILARDPRNLQAAVQLGNLLYDAGRYAEAVPAYQQAFAVDPRNVNVSTDLGTALWYSGRADDAIAQYEKSLAIDPKHGQTLFNVGIVKRDGKQDHKGAIAVWERLLAANPGYADRGKVEQAISQSRAALGPLAPGVDPQGLKPVR